MSYVLTREQVEALDAEWRAIEPRADKTEWNDELIALRRKVGSASATEIAFDGRFMLFDIDGYGTDGAGNKIPLFKPTKDYLEICAALRALAL